MPLRQTAKVWLCAIALLPACASNAPPPSVAACNTGGPPACSAPRVVTLLSEFHDRYREAFHGACVQHDLCYRHGLATYGFDRAECDARFLDDMRRKCRHWTNLDPADRLECEGAALHFEDMVRLYGEDRFEDPGNYCEYLGPPGSL